MGPLHRGHGWGQNGYVSSRRCTLVCKGKGCLRQCGHGGVLQPLPSNSLPCESRCSLHAARRAMIGQGEPNPCQIQKMTKKHVWIGKHGNYGVFGSHHHTYGGLCIQHTWIGRAFDPGGAGQRDGV